MGVRASKKNWRNFILAEEKNPFLSVVVPVYNAEKYLESCFRSIREQTFADYEIVVVDDGSTDGSPGMCDAYAASDSRVKVLHVPNGGPSRARNIGFREAKGEYIYCIDNDDFLRDGSYFQAIYDSLTKNPADLLQTGAVYLKGEERLPRKVLSFAEIGNEEIDHPERTICRVIADGIYETSCWTKVIRREFLLQNELFFDEALTVEDLDWNMRMLPLVKRYDLLPGFAYAHVFREGSISAATGERSYKNCQDQVAVIRRWSEKFIADTAMNEELKAALLSYLCYQYFITMGRCMTLEKRARREIRNELKQLRFIMTCAVERKQKFLCLLSRFLGFRGMLHLMGFYFKRMRSGA